MAKGKRIKLGTDEATLTANPFAAAFSDRVPTPGPDPQPQKSAPPASSPEGPGPELSFPPRVIVRRQKKGQGGKTVTCIEGLPQTTAAALLPRLKRELGCSGRIQDGLLVVGTRDHNRVGSWLTASGAPRVVLGN